MTTIPRRAARSSRTTRFSNRGFSFVEALVAMLAGNVLLAALTSFYLSEQRIMRVNQVQVEASQSLRTALDQIDRDLRVAGRNPSGASGIGITVATATEVRFTLDDDGNGSISSTSAEQKGFRLSGSTIQSYNPEIVGSWEALADGISSTGSLHVFRYFRADGSELTAPVTGADLALIRRVEVTLTATRPTPAGPAASRTASVGVRLRNRP